MLSEIPGTHAAGADVMVIAVVQLLSQARISLAFGTIANQDCDVCTAHFVARGGCAIFGSNSSGSPAMLDKLVTASCWHCRKAATVACSTAVCGCQNGGGCVESHSSSRRRHAQASQFHCVCLGSRFCTKNVISKGTSRASLPYLVAHILS